MNDSAPTSWMFSALLGLGLFLITQLFSLVRFSFPLHLALIFQAVAIPCLASGNIGFLGPISSYERRKRKNMVYSIGALGALASALSLGCVFYHFSKIAAVIFITCSFIVILLITQDH